MRPDIGDYLRGVKKTLAEIVFPTLTDPFALEQSAFIMLALEHLLARWDKAWHFCREENLALRGVLAEAAARLSCEASLPNNATSLLKRIQDRLRREEAADVGDRPYESLRDGNVCLRELLAELLGTVGGEEQTRSARAFIKAQLAREREWVRVGELVW
jgi:hypothetical protein